MQYLKILLLVLSTSVLMAYDSESGQVRIVDCISCNGTGCVVECRNCNGSGIEQARCGHCQGTGRSVGNMICNVCRGHGLVNQKCSWCMGSRCSAKCGMCNGSGKVIVKDIGF